MAGRRLTLGLVALVGASLLAPAGDAVASCVPPGDARDRLAAADAAFVGEYVRQKAAPGSGSSEEDVLVFSVREAIKGPLGDRVEVRDEGPNTSASLRPGIDGREIGLFLRRSGGQYVANGCMYVEPDRLRRAAGDSGIRGKVVLVNDGCGPAHPSDPPATTGPLDARLTFRNRFGRVVRIARSGRDGRFKVRLRPGTYRIEPGRSYAGAAESSGDYKTVRVRAGRFPRVTITYQDGCL